MPKPSIPPLAFDEVFFLLVEREPLPQDLRHVFAALVAQSRDPDFLIRAAHSPTRWIAFEAEHNPYHVEPDHSGPREQRVRL